MITRGLAGQIAEQFAGAPASDPDQGWHLEEFDAGWLIRRRATGNLRGTASHAVERASGRLMRFASYIPPERILEEYDQVVVRGFPEEPRPATLALHEFSAPADTV
jgi:hypothetical protein